MEPIFFFAILTSLVAWLGVGFAVYLWIRKTLLQIRSEKEGSIHHRILDEVEQVRIELGILGDRLHGMEERMEALKPSPEQSLAPSPEEARGPSSEEPGASPTEDPRLPTA